MYDRKGGPKELRLHRSALLSSHQDIDSLYPIKVTNIPKTASPEKLQRIFNKYGEVADVYIPRNLKTLAPAQDFAVVRFKKRQESEQALQEISSLPPSSRLIDNQPISAVTLHKQISVFSHQTGALGITNDPTGQDTSRFDHTIHPVEQNIALDECFSRSGYPWGSKRELKILEPHAPRETLNMHGIKLTNLNPKTSVEEIQHCFSKYGVIGCTYFPKPLQVEKRPKEPNIGIGFVRFEDKRDVESALRDINRGGVELEGVVLRGEYAPPQFWPSERTRRYF